MIVSTIVVTADEFDAGGAGVGLSVVGTSPANAVPDSAHASATTITKRFICVLLWIEDARQLAIIQKNAGIKLLAGWGC